MTPIEKLFKEMNSKMEKSIEFIHHEFSTIRTGKASSSLVENINVDYYGAPTRLKELAGISTPEPRMVVIQPWDPSVVGAVTKAINAANIGITPIADGKLVRIPIPELNEERRKELNKLVKKMAEDGRIAIRNIRRETNDEIKKMQKKGEISEDEMYRYEEKVQKVTDDQIEEIDGILVHKEKEIMEV